MEELREVVVRGGLAEARAEDLAIGGGHRAEELHEILAALLLGAVVLSCHVALKDLADQVLETDALDFRLGGRLGVRRARYLARNERARPSRCAVVVPSLDLRGIRGGGEWGGET